MDQNSDIGRYFRISRIVSGAMIGILIIYLIIVEVIRSQFKPFTGFVELEGIASLRYILFLVAALQIIFIRLLRGIILRARPKDDGNKLLLKMFRVSILTSVLAEVPALLGLVLFLLSGLNVDFYVLLFVSFFLIFMFFPRLNNWKAWIQENKTPCCI